MKRLRKHSEWFILPIAIVIYYLIPYLLRLMDPTAGAYDIGVLQAPFLAIVILYIGVFAVWLGLRISVPEVYRTLDQYLLHVKTLNEWQRGKFALSFFAVLVICFALIVLAIA